MGDKDFKFHTDGITNLLRAMKEQKLVVRVGILGTKDARRGGKKGNNSNATIGSFHEQLEYGGSKIPQRSFLRMPLETRLGKEIDKSKQFTKDALTEILKTKSLKKWADSIGVAAVSVVLQAFDSNGFGTWQKLEKSTLARKQVKQTLVETQQLRGSISSEVVKK